MRGILGVLPLLGTLLSAPVFAHELESNTARVTLRDGSIELRLDVNIQEWARESIKSGEVPPGRSSAEIMQLLQVGLIEGVRLRVDEEPTRFSNLRVQASEQDPGDHHGPTMVFLLDTRTPTKRPERITLKLPASLGPTLVNFVQPKTRWTPPGGENTFKVLSPGPSNADSSGQTLPEQSSPHSVGWLLGGLVLGTGIGFGVGRQSFRRDS